MFNGIIRCVAVVDSGCLICVFLGLLGYLWGLDVSSPRWSFGEILSGWGKILVCRHLVRCLCSEHNTACSGSVPGTDQHTMLLFHGSSMCVAVKVFCGLILLFQQG